MYWNWDESIIDIEQCCGMVMYIWEWLCINLDGYGIDKFIVTCSIRVMRE